MLVGLIVAIFIILLLLGVAAPKVARGLRRDREVEAIHRGNQYVRAIQLYYKKFGHYPGSIDQLEKTNNVRYLRQRYADPMTGKPDWRLIKVGEAKTTVKGFFGQPLAGLAPGLGTAASMTSPGIGTGSTGTAGTPWPSSLPTIISRRRNAGFPIIIRASNARFWALVSIGTKPMTRTFAPGTGAWAPSNWLSAIN